MEFKELLELWSFLYTVAISTAFIFISFWDWKHHKILHEAIGLLIFLKILDLIFSRNWEWAPSLIGLFMGLALPLLVMAFTNKWEGLGGGDVWLLGAVGFLFGYMGLGLILGITSVFIWLYGKFSGRDFSANPFPLGLPMGIVSCLGGWLGF